MEYKALYRKYRPKKFEDIVGQEHITRILKNSIINDKIGHAYLFSGPRGTGKTSTAKVLANTVNCLNPKDGEQCGECAICKLDENVDIIEIDAASNNGVDEIREIRQNAKLMPSNSKYKVYIIDEVHMLSMGAFNALLKTLEEPPKHVIFILATTEFQKVPLTIVSRCQKFQFKKLTINDIRSKLNDIVKKEKLFVTDEAITLIAEIADGGLRDAINLLDQASSTVEGEISGKQIADITGTVLQEEIEKFINNIYKNNIKEVLDYLNYLDETGKNYILFCEKTILYLRKKLISFAIENNSKKSKEYLNYIYTFIELNSDLKKSLNQKILFDVKMLELLNTKNDESESAKKEEIIIEKSFKDNAKDRIEKEKQLEEENVDIFIQVNKVRVNNTLATANKNILKNYQSNYNEINNFLTNSKFNNLIPLLLNSKITAASEDYAIISLESSTAKNFLLHNLNKTEELINIIYNKKIKLAFLTEKEWQEEIVKYKENIKNKIKYEIKEEPEMKFQGNITELEEAALDIFGEETIELN